MRATVFVLLLSGCTSIGTVDKNVAVPTGDEVLYVMGVTPENHRVRIVEGDVERGLFKQSQLALGPRLYAGASDGYVVFKGKKDEILAVTAVRVVKEQDSIVGQDFIACGERRTMVFRSPPGTVVYVGDVAYQFAGKRLSIRYGNNLEAARAFVARSYPQLRDHLVQGSFELLPTATPCVSGGGTVPIYIPAPRR